MAWARTDGGKRYLARIPEALRDNVLRGALRTMAKVVAEEQRAQCASDQVRAGIKVTSAEIGPVLVAKVVIKGRMASGVANWLEWGTQPHLVQVDAREAGGVGVDEVNRRVREGSLVIAGRFVGPVVHHPGAQAEPFFYTAFDHKRRDALAAGQAYIVKRLARNGLFAPDDTSDDA